MCSPPSRMNNSLPRPCLAVNPILQPEDRAAIDRLGVPSARSLLSSYYAIEEKLGFLDESHQGQGYWTWSRKELGYRAGSRPSTSPEELQQLS